MKLARQAQQHMALLTPVIRQVPRRILDHTHANVTKIQRPPVGDTGLAWVRCRLYFRPVRDREWKSWDSHSFSIIPFEAWRSCSIQVLLRRPRLHPPHQFVERNFQRARVAPEADRGPIDALQQLRRRDLQRPRDGREAAELRICPAALDALYVCRADRGRPRILPGSPLRYAPTRSLSRY